VEGVFLAPASHDKYCTRANGATLDLGTKGISVNLIGVNLKTPQLKSLMMTASLGLMVSAFAASLISAQLATVNTGLAITSGVIGGSLANIYGASIKENGWRAATISAAFSLLLLLLVHLLMSLSK
jgi:hypothetical protein